MLYLLHVPTQVLNVFPSDPDENNAPAAELGSPFRQRKPPTNPVTPPVSKVAMQKLLNPKRIRYVFS